MNKKTITSWSCYLRQGSHLETCLDGGGRLNPLTNDDTDAIFAVAKYQTQTNQTTTKKGTF